jgi:hypothetical protein
VKYTVQLEYTRPSYVDLVVEADSIEDACAKATQAGHEETCWIDDYDSCSPHYVGAIVPGKHDCLLDADSDRLTIPPQFRAHAVLADENAADGIDDIAHAAHAGVAGGFREAP